MQDLFPFTAGLELTPRAGPGRLFRITPQDYSGLRLTLRAGPGRFFRITPRDFPDPPLTPRAGRVPPRSSRAPA